MRYTVSLLSCLPILAAAAAVPPIVNSYSLTGFRMDVTLRSDVSECETGVTGRTSCSLSYSVTVRNLDGAYAINWLDVTGTSIASVSTTWDYYMNYDEKENYSNGSVKVGKTLVFAEGFNVQAGDLLKTDTGTATVNGSGFKFNNSNVTGCKSGSTSCPAPYYVLKADAGKSPLRLAADAAADPAMPVETAARVALLAYPFGNIDDVDHAIEKPLIEFRSAVAAVASGFEFTYSVENLGVIDQQFDWSAVGLSGRIALGAEVHGALISPFGPRLVSQQPRLATDPAVLAPISMDVLVPVPEAAPAMLLGAGLALLVGTHCRRRIGVRRPAAASIGRKTAQPLSW